MLALLLAATLGAAPAASPWKSLEPGLELGSFQGPANDIGDRQIHVLRVDLSRFELALLNASAEKRGNLTAKQWCAAKGCIAAINASMFKTDGLTSVGLMRTRLHVNNPDDVKKYKAVLAFDPLASSGPRAQLLDTDVDDLGSAKKRWGALVQNLRMVDAHRENRWGPSKKRWSTAAVALDSQGRLLFIHCRSPYPVHALVDALLALPLGLQRAMYVEGGPEAQLYVRAGGEEHEYVGSYETGFFESDNNHEAWPVPNVLAVMPKQ